MKARRSLLPGNSEIDVLSSSRRLNMRSIDTWRESSVIICSQLVTSDHN